MSVAPHIDSAFMVFVSLQKFGLNFVSVPPLYLCLIVTYCGLMND
ncbi:hypothetical protein HMPREF0659_A6484 [Prevotella melaninogenica ATCC 25845]|nr:hypothetical protein HMPREF0659_A6484 [Prevotella melaninogenica ATCC 25845]